MMNSYRQNDRPKRRLWAATLLVVFLFAADWFSGGALRHVVRAGAAGISHSVSTIAADIGGSGFFSSNAGLAAQNRTLAQQVAQLQEHAAYDAVLQNENDQLRSLEHLAQTASGITAPIVSSVISSPYGTFLIGAGSADGLRAGNLVLTQDGFAVGTVSDVGTHVSTVKEIFASDSPVNVVINSSAATLSGSGGGNAHVLLPRGAQVAEGDAVIAPELAGHAVGIVGAVASSSASATQDVYVSLPVNLGGLEFVYVVTS